MYNLKIHVIMHTYKSKIIQLSEEMTIKIKYNIVTNIASINYY